ncbi:uncharacterized protein LOC126791058 isoform X1 [Argentina anserina]|uniref:uncharacterized protein LOC126791058 isoform X1 n=1 Tax=Argentina anserina TaxID=57926 RepID=UPI0021762E91|nr:uncharacterized protein LOC126791058 isoform X1 [Potentilla anserina]
MEEIREAALAYYHNLPEDLQKMASAKFKEIDSNGNGTISMREFKNGMGSSFDNDSVIMKRTFKELDKTGDGKLDFNEYITLYYLVESGRVLIFCAGHGCEAGPFLKGLYFTCVDCFHHNENETFDLCTSCYRNGDFDHEHTNFVDNHVLLRSKAACCDESTFDDESCSSGSSSESNQVSRSGSKRVQVKRSGTKRRAVFGAIKSGVSVAKVVGSVSSGDAASDAADSCTIM